MADDWTQRIIDEFRANDGTVTSAPFGRSLVLLHHTGAKSGTARVTPVMGIRVDDDTWLIAASKAGAPDNPGWYHNLLAHPDVTIEAPGEGEVAVHATQLKDAARDEAWARFTTRSPGFTAYQQKTTRIIPVLALRRRD
ncbi:nitroreductase family deazaflavin-dependent oxidoreductase [Microbacterium protaetiae]|uniref:Nitroreductase family deazaflavin-dependent oxidoreductase n=1 Tax=Microbacterium protaetiae TaxID=2509458 RepID=A0A4P6ED62_9MICO|nr:nitroreductase/quinone reductase family protein [Microbacterium protaetiae]QAY59626.1 nitroreductase family deazaflavin-dependent oxidoreductase [Microbacterium protaetiae]